MYKYFSDNLINIISNNQIIKTSLNNKKFYLSYPEKNIEMQIKLPKISLVKFLTFKNLPNKK